jgi:hypothetical protein
LVLSGANLEDGERMKKKIVRASAAWLLSVALLAFLGACSGGSDSPTQPEGNRVVTLTRVDTSVLQRIGKKTSIRQLFIAKDAAGAVIPNAEIRCETPTGFALNGDSLITIGGESRGKLKCLATTVPLTPSTGFTPSTGPTDSLTITAGIDLRAYHWRLSFGCLSVGSAEADPIDSVDVTNAPVDSVVYPGDASFIRNFAGVAQLWYHGEYVRFHRSSAQDTVAFAAVSGTLESQRPDSLQFDNDPSSNRPLAPAVLVQASPRKYVGGSFCNVVDRRKPVTFEEILP